MDTKGNLVKDYQDTTIFGEGSIQKDRSARFTGKPYDEDLQAYVFPYRNYDASTARWRSSDPAGYPDGINQHFYACIPSIEIDNLGMWIITTSNISLNGPIGKYEISGEETFNGTAIGSCTIEIIRENSDTKDLTLFYTASLISSVGSTKHENAKIYVPINNESYVANISVPFVFNNLKEGIYSYYFEISTVRNPTPAREFSVVER